MLTLNGRFLQIIASSMFGLRRIRTISSAEYLSGGISYTGSSLSASTSTLSDSGSSSDYAENCVNYVSYADQKYSTVLYSHIPFRRGQRRITFICVGFKITDYFPGMIMNFYK